MCWQRRSQHFDFLQFAYKLVEEAAGTHKKKLSAWQNIKDDAIKNQNCHVEAQ